MNLHVLVVIVYVVLGLFANTASTQWQQQQRLQQSQVQKQESIKEDSKNSGKGLIVNEEEGHRWYLYRILGFNSGIPGRRNIDEGNGLEGLKSRSKYYGQMKPIRQNRRVTVLAHVADNPEMTPWISTSTNKTLQEEKIRKALTDENKSGIKSKGRYMVVIDARLLKAKNIVDLNSEYIRSDLLGTNLTAYNAAKDWQEVLVFWEVPKKAILKSLHYTYTPSAKKQSRRQLVDINDWAAISNLTINEEFHQPLNGYEMSVEIEEMQ